MRPLAFIAMAIGLLAVTGTAATARHTHPSGWDVEVRAHPVSKHGLYDIDVLVKDEAGKPVRDASVEVRLHSFKEPGYRLVRAKRVEDGWFRTRTRLNPPHDWPRRLRAIVTAGDDRS
jgi:hypothetical protein